MGRRRGLTPEDRRLWAEVARTAKPLRPPAPPSPAAIPPASDVPPASDAVPRPAAARPPADPPANWRPGLRAAGRPAVTLDLAEPHVLERAHPHMDRRRFEKLRRGRMEPEARLDLHGMTAERAHGALTGFILSAHARDLRLVLVITGKGRTGDSGHPSGHGILRHSVPHWLGAPPLAGRVLQVASAHRRHGGAGAFYVYLRRRSS